MSHSSNRRIGNASRIATRRRSAVSNSAQPAAIQSYAARIHLICRKEGCGQALINLNECTIDPAANPDCSINR